MFGSIYIKMFKVITTMLIISTALFAEREKKERRVSVTPTAEIGFLSVLSNKIQFGEEGTYIDYRKDAGQEILYPVTRFSVDFAFGERHKAVLLYQPLSIESENVIQRDITLDNTTFTKGTPVKFTYGFPFYRVSYLYDFLEDPDKELAAGLSLQLRNANITFASLDGTQLHTQRDVGPVPILKFRHRLPIGQTFWWGSEIDGFYAPVSYLNGSDEEVVGAIIDASLRGGIRIKEKGDTFLNVRYLAGGAVGTNSDDADATSDGYVKNWLHFLTVSLGFAWDIL